MIQIIHLSDFHLNEKNLNDWKSFVKKAFIENVKQLDIDLTQTIVVCTGDLIDKGNLNFDKTRKSFDLFKEEVINVICQDLSIPLERFFIVAGNHDIDRNNDSKRIEAGNREFYKNYDNILSSVKEILDNEEREGICRNIPFSEFVNDLYKDITPHNKYLSFLGNAFICEIDNNKVGISCLNSSWRCYDDNDKEYLILGEEQLNRCSNFIKECDIKIALMHHPLDWFNLEQGIIAGHITKDYDVLLVGHVHESQTITQTGFSGTLFTNIAPSCTSDIREDSKAFSNGFTVIKIDKVNKEVDCSYYKYVHKDKKFIDNENIGEKGRKIFKIPDINTTATRTLIEKCLKNIQDSFYNTIDEHIISQKVHIIENIKDAFEMPPLTEKNVNEDNEIIYLTLDEVCKTKSNLCIFGASEIGKTTLLYRILREYVDEYNHIRKIPVYIDYKESGNKDIITCIKSFLSCNTEDAKMLLSENHIILLIDNLDFCTDNKDKVNKLNSFNREFESIQIIATSESILDIPSEEFIRKSTIPFRNLYIRPLKSSHMKNLMVKWLPKDDNLKREAKLEKMVNNFCSYSLPCTAMSVSLFLWSTENSDRKPINQSVLLDIYIEIILEKLSKENIYIGSFDYKNKCMLLGHIAQEMLKSDKPNYALPYETYIKIISDYIKSVGFDFDISKIGEYFVERKIFVKVNINDIKFAHSCFFQFFIAKRMEDNEKFRADVLDENVYYKFPRELDYYTGLTRNDNTTLNLIYQRFQTAFEGIEYVFNEVNVDKFFTDIVKNPPAYNPIIKAVNTDMIKNSRPTEEKILEFYDNKLSKVPDDSIRKKIDDFNLEKLIIIMCNVLRNSEGIENYNLKKKYIIH